MSERQSDRLLRDTVHSELTALLETGGPLHVRPAPITLELGGSFIEDIAVTYRAATPGAPFEGRSAIVTAGPPGAGKSSATKLIDSAEYRRIDADQIKDRILWVLDSQGLLATRHDHTLADGRPVYPAELAWWVHNASTDAADLVRQACLADGENFLMEGTLAWHRLPAEYVTELVDFDYESLTIIDIEVPLSVAQVQARERWWACRNDSNPTVGGRFISDDAIMSFYVDNDHVSVCASHARDLYNGSVEYGLDTELAIVSRTTTGHEHAAVVTPTEVREWKYQKGRQAPPMGAACLRCGRHTTSPRSIRRGLGTECLRHI